LERNEKVNKNDTECHELLGKKDKLWVDEMLLSVSSPHFDGLPVDMVQE
jgi:hypothetical protein